MSDLSDLMWVMAWDLNDQNPDDNMVFTVDGFGPYYCGYLRKANTRDLLTRVEAANAMMAFLDQHGGDVGQPWPTMEDALAWLAADNG